jgi:hypothetical protein
MAQSIPIDVYQFLEERVGKEEAKKVATAVEIGLGVIEKRAEEVALQKKLELRDELTKELASKTDILLVRQEMQTIKAELEAKIELVETRLNTKLNFLIVLMVIALTLMNPVAADIIKQFLKL